jgi:hypothetical protein
VLRGRSHPRAVGHRPEPFAPTIPAAAWRGAHLDPVQGALWPCGTDPRSPLEQRGGCWGLGANVIEIAADDLRAHFSEPRKGGRKTKVDETVKRQIFALLDYHGLPNSGDPEWKSQADVEKVVQELANVSESTAREHTAKFIAEWTAQKAGN